MMRIIFWPSECTSILWSSTQPACGSRYLRWQPFWRGGGGGRFIQSERGGGKGTQRKRWGWRGGAPGLVQCRGERRSGTVVGVCLVPGRVECVRVAYVLGLCSFDSPVLDRPGRPLHQQGPREARLGVTQAASSVLLTRSCSAHHPPEWHMITGTDMITHSGLDL